jgi:hypothetical protein
MHQKISTGPKRDLYIYYLKGRLKTESGMFQNNFIGNWEEEDDSFLFFSSPALRQIQSLLNRQRQLSCVDSYEMSYDQWLGEVFSTFEHGKFHITPIWDCGEDETAEDKIRILLDPGLVIANIHYDVMRNLVNTEGFVDKKRFILSGLLRSEAKDIADSLAQHPVKIIKQWARDGIWHTFYGQMEQDGSYNSQ